MSMNKKTLQIIQYVLVPLGALLCSTEVFCIEVARDIGDVFQNFSEQYTPIARLIIGVSAVSGIGFGIAAVYKFKQYKDNPTQIPIGTPVALLIVSVLMWFMPGVVEPAAQSMFGKRGASENFSYGLDTSRPGFKDNVNELLGRQGLGS